MDPLGSGIGSVAYLPLASWDRELVGLLDLDGVASCYRAGYSLGL